MPTKAELMAENERLKKDFQTSASHLARMGRELTGTLTPEELPPATIPSMIRGLMREYKLPWECFWCDAHRSWFVLLDSSFPYHWEDCKCSSCMNSDAYGEGG